jgi:hypothetical protein
MTEHPVNGLDDVVHQRVRLGILTITHQAKGSAQATEDGTIPIRTT